MKTKILVAFIIIFSLFNFSFAQEIEDSGAGNPTQDISIRLGNPLENGGVRDIPTLVREILKIVITVGVPIVALAIIYSGFLFVAAQGNPEKLKKAKETLLYVIIGAAILLGAYVIAEAIEATVAAIRGN
ncbi:MAG: hypothetical protein ACJA2Z_000366 [Candidatus Paceibacteria bacterium]|jgi:hypothetical protein